MAPRSQRKTRTAWTALAATLAAAAPVCAAEVSSQSCARWEGNYRALVLEVGAFLIVAAFLVAWIAPWIMRATGRLWRWALGVTGRSLWPGMVLALLATILWLLVIFPGPWRGELAAFQIQSEYFPAARAADSMIPPGTAKSVSLTWGPTARIPSRRLPGSPC